MSGRAVAEAYREALDAPCPDCGAKPGEYCTRNDGNRAPTIRRMPCVKRCTSYPTAPDAPIQRRPSARSFDQPLHQLDEPDEEPQ